MYDDDRAFAASGLRAVLRASNCRTNLDIDVRSAGADDALNLTPVRKLTLEDALEYIGEEPN